MAAGFRRDGGGIRSLLNFITKHQEAVEFDLIGMGLRLDWLGTKRLSWRDLWVIVRQSPATSAIYRAEVGPVEARWSLGEHLLAEVVDALRLWHWANTKDAGKPSNPAPDPYPRPGVEPPHKPQKHGSDPLTIEEMDAWLGWNTAEIAQIDGDMDELNIGGGGESG